MNRLIQREKNVHGTAWHTVHDGYFADAAVASPLVKTIRQVAAVAQPDAIIDLGGGTGFLLGRVLAEGLERETSLINLDDSSMQLRAARSRRITCLQGSVEAFSRRDAGLHRTRCLFVMRSVLHYFGQRGLGRVLRRLRAQARPGEFFVHQTASFRRTRDAACLNDLYATMRTPKWYPTVAALSTALRAAGWNVLAISPAPPLRLTSEDLAGRYQLAATEIRRIRERCAAARPPPDVFHTTPTGFIAHLHYWTYLCEPAGPGNRRRPFEHDQAALALWAADCAQEVLPLFEIRRPKDLRPRKAIDAARAWARGGISCGEARKAAVAAHAAARAARHHGEQEAAARAAGHAAATAHMPGHARHAAHYAVKATVAADGL